MKTELTKTKAVETIVVASVALDAGALVAALSSAADVVAGRRLRTFDLVWQCHSMYYLRPKVRRLCALSDS